MDKAVRELYNLYYESIGFSEPGEALDKKEEIFSKLKDGLGDEEKADDFLTDIYDLISIYQETFFVYGFEKAKALLK